MDKTNLIGPFAYVRTRSIPQIATFTKTFDDKSMLAVLDSTKQARFGSLELGLAQICDWAEPTNQLVLLTCGPSKFWEYSISIATTMQGSQSKSGDDMKR